MRRRQLLALCLLLVGGRISAQSFALVETPQVGDCYQVELTMKLAGEMRVFKDGKPVPMKLNAAAQHHFPERILAVDRGLPTKTARAYEKAQATITVDGVGSERTLRPERRLLVAQRHHDQPLVYSPAGPLTRDELDLTSEHFDTLALVGLLPGKSVAVGDSWKIPDPVVQALCHFEGLSSHDLTGSLVKVEDGLAHVRIAGSATGIDLGALAKLKIEAQVTYQLASKTLTSLEWRQTDERDQGPASPALAVEATTRLTRRLVETPPALSDEALVEIPDGFEVPPPLTQIECRDPKGRFELLHAREWHVVGQTNEHLVMRLLERGDFVAQVTITPWAKAKPGEHMSAEDFQQEMANIPGWEPEQVLQSGEVPLDSDRWCYRLSVLGMLEDLKVLQNFYLVAGPGGDQVVVAFTMKQSVADKLGTRDLSLVGSLELPRGPSAKPR
ncbi:MAG: hypothetical protein NZ700_07910 [Gemmataceae bacterium]|nr:hypothetical protein [Gemmataceae bacterium]MDW8265928.1 hypothetical protein [Gemmataceae bacterium]